MYSGVYRYTTVNVHSAFQANVLLEKRAPSALTHVVYRTASVVAEQTSVDRL